MSSPTPTEKYMGGGDSLEDELAAIRKQRMETEGSHAPMGSVSFDQHIYGSDTKQGYHDSLPMNEDDLDDEVQRDARFMPAQISAPSDILNDLPIGQGQQIGDPMAFHKKKSIAAREDDYKRAARQRRMAVLSPERSDPFAEEDDGKGGAGGYKEQMKRQALEKEEDRVKKIVAEKIAQEKEDKRKNRAEVEKARDKKKRSRWDEGGDGGTASKRQKTSEWDEQDGSATPGGPSSSSKWDDATPKRASRWDMKTPTASKTPSRWDQTPQAGASGRSRWDETPRGQPGTTPRSGKSRWDETPAVMAGGMTPGVTPVGNYGAETPMITNQAIAGQSYDPTDRNRPLSFEELDDLLPGPSEGYIVLEPPAAYKPIRTPARKLQSTPKPMTGGFMDQQKIDPNAFGRDIKQLPNMPEIKAEDMPYFETLLDGTDETLLNADQAKERKIMRLLLKIKNGTPQQRKQALRQITDKACDFGPGPLFNKILPLLMAPTLEDQERHLLVKVIDRILYKLDDLVRPYVHKILVVIEPLLIDEDYYARVEGREIISNLAKAAGLATMIATMRPDIDNLDEYVRNTTARAFAVVASSLSIPSLLPFLKAVCQSKKSWQARHTGIKIVQRISILMGCAILPHLRDLVSIIEHGLKDDQQKVRTITARSLAALAEAAYPYGIESFDSVLKPLWYGIQRQRGKGLAAFLKAIGQIIPLMASNHASHYTKEVMEVLKKQFSTPEEEMKKIVLQVIKQCVSCDGVEATYVREDILEDFFKQFWIRRMALDRRNYRALVDTTVEIANKVGAREIISSIVGDLKDDSEPFRRMVMETIDKTISALGASELDQKLEESLVDGILYAFQEQTSEDSYVILNGFGTVCSSLGLRVKPYVAQICGTIKWRLKNRMPRIRQIAADLISRVAFVMKACGEEKLLGRLGTILYEYLGEEYPEVLGSILGALKAIVNVIGMTKMQPPIKDLLPRLTPILRNRHEKVQENVIDLVGRIADRGSEFVSAREWMRICFELLEMLKAHKKSIRRATVNTFGYIAKAIGPQDVLATLLNNLRVQERQNRVCTTVAIAIVAETCAPFTVLPALMNEYRVPELNVQNGVLKALSFLFEYIQEMGKDYIYAVTPLLEDALMDRDLVHRQTAAWVVKHMALGVAYLGCEDALIHLLNCVWPNLFETSPHVIQAVTEAIDGLSVSIGPCIVVEYLLQGLFHPARIVRTAYWKLYNRLYMRSQDALVSSWPTLPSDKRNVYTRHELELFI